MALQALGKENMFGFETTIVNQFYLIYCISGTAVRLIALPWVVICHNEAQRIINELNSLTEGVGINIDNYKDMEPKFRKILSKCIRDVNDLQRMVSNFRGYFEAIAGVILPITLYIEIVHALVFVSPGYSFILKVKEVSAFASTLEEVYVICWIGAKLEDMTEDLAFAVYSTPWYWLKSIRKDVYIFLCQTQTPINPMALSVYPLTSATFLRFCNVINSTVNVFRAYTQRE